MPAQQDSTYRSKLARRLKQSNDFSLLLEYIENVLIPDAESERDALDVLDNDFNTRYALIHGELEGYRKFLELKNNKEMNDA